MRFVSVAGGIGGGRAGLERAGWECVGAFDEHADSAAMHASAFGDCNRVDLNALRGDQLPRHDVLYASLTSEPLPIRLNSTWSHGREPTALESILRITREATPIAALFETGYRFLSQQGGYRMAFTLAALTAAGYQVEWQVLDASWFGVPQTRPRLVIFAWQKDYRGLLPSKHSSEDGLECFGPPLTTVGYHLTPDKETFRGSIAQAVANSTPRLGRSRDQVTRTWRSSGRAIRDSFVSYNARGRSVEPLLSLERIAGLAFVGDRKVAAVRFYSRRGVTKPAMRQNGYAYCVGSKVSAAPLLAISEDLPMTVAQRTVWARACNWHRHQDGWKIFRLTPANAVQLFGPNTELLQRAIAESTTSARRKYILLVEMAAPLVMHSVGVTLHQNLEGSL